jgi:hypothetical protein
MSGSHGGIRILVLGLSGSGKTCLLKNLKPSAKIDPGLTLGHNVEWIKLKDMHYIIWDVSGRTELQQFIWKLYERDVPILWWCISANDSQERIRESANALGNFMRDIKSVTHFVLVTTTEQNKTSSSEGFINETFRDCLLALRGRGLMVSRTRYNTQGSRNDLKPLFPDINERHFTARL